MKTIYWISISIIVIIIVIIIWLLIRGGGSICDLNGQLNDSCSENGDCNSGLVCTNLLGGSGVCKVASGGVCLTTSECGIGLTCQNGVCLGKGGVLNDPCPCSEGFTCINNVCKVATGEVCMLDSDCASGNCVNGVCLGNLTDLQEAFGSLTDLVSGECDCSGCNSRSSKCSKSNNSWSNSKSKSSKSTNDWANSKCSKTNWSNSKSKCFKTKCSKSKTNCSESKTNCSKSKSSDDLNNRYSSEKYYYVDDSSDKSGFGKSSFDKPLCKSY